MSRAHLLGVLVAVAVLAATFVVGPASPAGATGWGWGHGDDDCADTGHDWPSWKDMDWSDWKDFDWDEIDWPGWLKSAKDKFDWLEADKDRYDWLKSGSKWGKTWGSGSKWGWKGGWGWGTGVATPTLGAQLASSLGDSLATWSWWGWGDKPECEEPAVEVDLALRKRRPAGTSSEVVAGEDATFEISVFNQGDTPVENVTIIDYIPNNWTLSPNDQNGWTGTTDAEGNTAYELVIPGPIEPGAHAVINQIVLVAQMPDNGGKAENCAEITGATSGGLPVVDIDSTYDTDPHNDPVVNNVIGDDGTEDEDDHDIEFLTVVDVP